MKLISLSDYVLETDNNGDFIKTLPLIRAYASFLQQDLKLGMFLPCDKDGNIIEGKPLSPASDEEWVAWDMRRDSFMKGMKEVLFENITFFNYENTKMYSIGKTQIFQIYEGRLYWHHNTIESILSEFDDTITIKSEF